MMSEKDTIAAISTAMNNSGIGIIRISGERAFEILSAVFQPADKCKDMMKVPGHTVHYGHIVDHDEVIDEVLVLIMRAPHTYTREDTVEIDCHGGMFVMKRVLELVLASGARPAQPGEFTKRAFLNGRIDLTQAEAVIDVINAENTFALESAVSQLKGSVSGKVRGLRDILIEKIAFIEAALDDPEHYELEDYGTQLFPVLEAVRMEIEQLLQTADDGRILTEGISTVILGKPNVGKSSLLNALLGMERAIVTQIPGTTRDALEEKVRLGDLTLNIIDTAGIRNTDDIVEKIGVDRSRDYASRADLIIWMIDGSRPLDTDDRQIIQLVSGKKAIIILNKQDLPTVSGEKEIAKMLSENGEEAGEAAGATGKLGKSKRLDNNIEADKAVGEAGRSGKNRLSEDCAGDGEFRIACDEESFNKNINKMLVTIPIPIIRTSVKEQEGIDEVIQTIQEMFYRKEINFNDQVYITNIRQKQLLSESLCSLEKAMESIRNQVPEDFYTIDLMDAYAHLGSVIGETVEDDLADEIFSKFCMGK